MAASDLLTSFYFSVSVSGQSSDTDAAFHEVTGMQKELDLDEVASGGENRFKYRLPKGVKFSNLVLKRGVVMADSPLINWCKETLNEGLSAAIKPKNVLVTLFNPEGQSCQSWTFVKAYPVKWAASDLGAQKNELFIETIEMAYQYFNVEARQ